MENKYVFDDLEVLRLQNYNFELEYEYIISSFSMVDLTNSLKISFKNFVKLKSFGFI